MRFLSKQGQLQPLTFIQRPDNETHNGKMIYSLLHSYSKYLSLSSPNFNELVKNGKQKFNLFPKISMFSKAKTRTRYCTLQLSTLLCRLQRKMKIYLSEIQFSQNSFLNKTAPCKSILPWQNEGPLHINPDFLQPQGN